MTDRERLEVVVEVIVDLLQQGVFHSHWVLTQQEV
jgi:hypothetical protein